MHLLGSGLLEIPDHDFSKALTLLFAFVICHALGDFPLQGAFLARFKNRHFPPKELGVNEEAPPSLWIYCLTYHSLIHAGFVWLITGSVILGLAELAVHWLIDFVKCERWTNFHTDQLLHLATKLAYAALVYFGLVEMA